MTFLEYLRRHKEIDVDSCDIMELMERHYNEYRDFLLTVKDGCGVEDDGLKTERD